VRGFIFGTCKLVFAIWIMSGLVLLAYCVCMLVANKLSIYGGPVNMQEREIEKAWLYVKAIAAFSQVVTPLWIMASRPWNALKEWGQG